MSISRRTLVQQLILMGAAARLPHARSDRPTADDPLFGTVREFQARRARGEFTAEAITRRALERARTLDARLHCVDLLDDAGALAAARASDARARAGRLRGPLDGAPVFAKSIYDMVGTPTTASSWVWSRLFPERCRQDAIELSRVRAAGVVILGKTAADDFAYRGNGTSSLTGQVLNPYDVRGVKTPGGSSAGSAVAVACGCAFAAFGTDDGGSNRIPAQFTGVVGMKPTFGLVPRSGVIPTWPVLDTHGPLARTVEDAALLLFAIAGPEPAGTPAVDALASTTRGADLSAFEALRASDIVVGRVDAHVPSAHMSATSLALWERAVGDVRAAGMRVVDFTPSVTRATVRDDFARAAATRGDVAVNANAPALTVHALHAYFARQGRDADRAVERGLAAFRAFYDVIPADLRAARALLEMPGVNDPSARSFLQSRATVCALLARDFSATGVRVMIYPTMPFSAPAAADAWPDIRTTLGYGNWLGIPEVSVPSGYTADGLPGGNVSFVGLPGDDALVLAAAHAYERQSRRFVSPT